jgi:hypothetical protein
MQTAFEYIHFEKVPADTKTARYLCFNTQTGYRLGVVNWSGAWRQYVFHPEAGTVFSAGCLKDVQTFIGELMAQRRAERKAARDE